MFLTLGTHIYAKFEKFLQLAGTGDTNMVIYIIFW